MKTTIKAFFVLALAVSATTALAELQPLSESELHNVFIASETRFEHKYNYNESTHDPIWQDSIALNQNITQSVNFADINSQAANIKYQSERLATIDIANQYLLGNPQSAFVSIPFIQLLQSNTTLDHASQNFPNFWIDFGTNFLKNQ
jgi:hypothetical protein